MCIGRKRSFDSKLILQARGPVWVICILNTKNMNSKSISITSLLFVIVCSFAFFTFVAHAQTASTTRADQQEERQEAFEARQQEQQARAESRAASTTARQEERQTQIENRASSTAARQEVRAERKAALEIRVQERITNVAMHIGKRILTAIKRIEAITTRIETRADKLEAKGLDMSKAKAHIDEAKSSLANAEASVNDIDIKIADAVTSENPRESWASSKVLFMEIKEQIILTKSLLREAVEEMKKVLADRALQNDAQGTTTSQIEQTSTGN